MNITIYIDCPICYSGNSFKLKDNIPNDFFCNDCNFKLINNSLQILKNCCLFCGNKKFYLERSFGLKFLGSNSICYMCEANYNYIIDNYDLKYNHFSYIYIMNTLIAKEWFERIQAFITKRKRADLFITKKDIQKIINNNHIKPVEIIINQLQTCTNLEKVKDYIKELSLYGNEKERSICLTVLSNTYPDLLQKHIDKLVFEISNNYKESKNILFPIIGIIRNLLDKKHIEVCKNMLNLAKQNNENDIENSLTNCLSLLEKNYNL